MKGITENQRKQKQSGKTKSLRDRVREPTRVKSRDTTWTSSSWSRDQTSSTHSARTASRGTFIPYTANLMTVIQRGVPRPRQLRDYIFLESQITAECCCVAFLQQCQCCVFATAYFNVFPATYSYRTLTICHYIRKSLKLESFKSFTQKPDIWSLMG